MSEGVILIVGATGDVGRGIVGAALASGQRVIASSRSNEKLKALAEQHNSDALACVRGDISSEDGAAILWADASKPFGAIDNVIVSVNAPNKIQVLTEWSADELSSMLSSNLLVHFIAAKVFQPLLPETGLLLGIGGGTADFIIPKMAYVSMVQAAQRMLYKGLAREHQGGATIQELMVVSMVAGESNRDRAKPEWVTDHDVGRHVCAILDDRETFAKPVLHLKSRDQVGLPETAA